MKFSFFSIAPELKLESGHLLPYHRKVKEVVEALGGEFTGYIHLKSPLSLSEGWKKWFRRKNVSPFNLSFLRKMFMDVSRIYLKEKGVSKRIFFLESFHTGDLLSFTLATFFFAKKSDRIWILFRFQRKPWEMQLQKFLIKMISKKTLLFSDSELLAKELEKLFSNKVDLLTQYVSSVSVSPKEKNEKIILSWLGGPRDEKGLSLIQRLTTINDAFSEKFELTVSESVSFKRENGLGLNFSKDCLTEASYNELFSKSDCLLFPYDPQSYRLRTSGIFIESILSKKIPLVRTETWAAFELKKYGLDVLIIDWENPYFFKDLFYLIQEQSLLEKLGLMHSVYKEEHSMTAFREKFDQALRNYA